MYRASTPPALVLGTLLLLADAPALADSANFELSGKLYTKWMYKNDDSRGCLSLSNPFWPDNIGGSNGVCSEFELNIKGRVSKYVTTGVRIQSRWGALWQSWWENGDVRWDYPNDSLFHENTSGESMGLNHAQYMKLRGVFIRAALPLPSVRWVHFGASDFGMWNEWTIGKLRYIDRDNGNGVLFEGAIDDDYLRYHFGAIALPKLFVGPPVSTHVFWSVNGTTWNYDRTIVAGTSPQDTQWMITSLPASNQIKIILAKSDGSISPPTGPYLRWYELIAEENTHPSFCNPL